MHSKQLATIAKMWIFDETIEKSSEFRKNWAPKWKTSSSQRNFVHQKKLNFQELFAKEG